MIFYRIGWGYWIYFALDALDAMYGDACKIPMAETLVLRRAYYSALSYTDAQIGHVLKELEAQGLADNTIIGLWADHGGWESTTCGLN